jgi:hypothetical protein
VSVQNTGIHNLPKNLQNYVLQRQRRINKLALLSRSMTADEQEHFTRGALIENALTGKDKAPQSLKMLGLDKRVSMFAADTQANIVLIQPPAHVLDRIAMQLQQQPSVQVIESKEDAGVPEACPAGHPSPGDE